jgi:tRNA A-37 threonylcarbamoyl transferase component Bud32
MDPKSLAQGLPEDVAVIGGPRGVLAVRLDLADAFLAAGFAPDDRPRPGGSDAIGKRALGEVRTPAGSALVRRFRHGGLLRWLTGERFASPGRPFDEWRLQLRLSSLGVRSPAVVAARAVRAAAWGWRLDLATERIAGSLDLGLWWALRRDGRLDDARWRALLCAAGRLVADLHERGFEHADLTPRNLLARIDGPAGSEPQLWVIDLDGSRFSPAALDPRRRAANLARLDRHLARMQREHGLRLSRGDRWRFLRAYAPDRSQRRRLARALGRGPGGWHRLGWFLERRLGRGRGAAEARLRRSAS